MWRYRCGDRRFSIWTILCTCHSQAKVCWPAAATHHVLHLVAVNKWPLSEPKWLYIPVAFCLTVVGSLLGMAGLTLKLRVLGMHVHAACKFGSWKSGQTKPDLLNCLLSLCITRNCSTSVIHNVCDYNYGNTCTWHVQFCGRGRSWTVGRPGNTPPTWTGRWEGLWCSINSWCTSLLKSCISN